MDENKMWKKKINVYVKTVWKTMWVSEHWTGKIYKYIGRYDLIDVTLSKFSFK